MTVYFFALLHRPNGKSNCIKTFSTFESVIKVFDYPFGIRFVLKNYAIWHHWYCSKICDFLKWGYLCSDCACARSGHPIEIKYLEKFGQGAFLCMQLTIFDHQVSFPECRVDGYKFCSVYRQKAMISLFFIHTISQIFNFLYQSNDLTLLTENWQETWNFNN